MSISAAELGNAFVTTCLKLFQGNGFFLYLAVLCVIFLIVWRKSEWRQFWGFYSLFLLVIVFNPFLIWRVVNALGLDDEYYRFVWLIPVTVVVAYVGTLLVEHFQKKIIKAAALLAVIAVVFLTGSTIFDRDFSLFENVYKIPDEVIEICEIIRADCDKDAPCVAAEFDLDVLINQYAPDIDLILNYRNIAQMRELEALDQYVDDPEERLLYVLIDENTHDEGFLVYALRNGDVDYVVISRGSPVREYVAESGCRLIAELDEYCIFRVELDA